MKLEDHHMVQCETCQSIVNFIPADIDEVPTVLSIAKCSKCSGTIEDERRILPYEFPDVLI